MYKCSKHDRELYATFMVFGKPERRIAVFKCPVLGCTTIRANKWAKKHAKRVLDVKPK